MAAFNWDKCYVTGLPSVDQQHQALVDLINRYGDLLTAGEQVSDGDLDAVLQELAGYADYHFDEEEKLMTQAGLDARHIQQHKLFHAEFLHEVVLMKESLEKRHDKAQQLLKFLTYWLAYHILGTDQSMARQMAAVAAGRDPRLAYVADQDEQEGATEPLLRALNGLFDQVSQRNRELRELNSTLEAKVQERTQALLQANKMLEQIAMTDVLTGLPVYAMGASGSAASASAWPPKPLPWASPTT